MLTIFKNLSYREVVNEWLDSKKGVVKNSTYYKYEHFINSYIMQFFENKSFKHISNDDIELFFNKTSVIKLSSNTKNLIFSILYSSINYGISKGYHKKMTLCYLKFKVDSRNIEYLTKTEQSILENYICRNMNTKNLLILISLYSGTRLGEICALKGSDIDFVNNTISIRRTVQRIKNNDTKTKTKLVVDTPKTNSSIRVIPIPIFIMDILKEYTNDINNFIFTNSNNPKDPRSVEKYFSKLLEDLNIRHLKFHSLRHTYATRLREQKADIKVISELLGHSNWKITQDIYVHASFECKKNSVKEIAKNWQKTSS